MTSSGSADRFARRARARQWGTLRPVLLGVLLVSAVAAAVWAVLFSDLLAVRQVKVEGVSARVTTAEVRAAARVPAGTPLMRVDREDVAARVERLRPVAAAAVHRSWPHVLRIDVTERRPAAVLPDGEGYVVVDATGVVFAKTDRRPAGVPELHADAASRAHRHTLRAALQVLADVPDQVAGRVTGVSAHTTDDVVLRLRDGVRVVWGSPEHGAAKADVLAALMKRPGRVYDVSAPGAPAVRR